jgi:hypothetical protein
MRGVLGEQARSAGIEEDQESSGKIALMPVMTATADKESRVPDRSKLSENHRDFVFKPW